MSPQIWLPITRKGRTRNILIPYAHDIDGTQLDEIIAWQKEKTIAELDKMPPKPERTISKHDVGKMLDEYTKFLRRKQEDGTKRFY